MRFLSGEMARSSRILLLIEHRRETTGLSDYRRSSGFEQTSIVEPFVRKMLPSNFFLSLSTLTSGNERESKSYYRRRANVRSPNDIESINSV